MPAKARAPHPDDWAPNEGPQARFLSLTCFEALYGGAAGGGKSDSILVDAIRYVGRGYGSNYQALLLRTTFPALEKSLILRSHALYPRIGGTYLESKKTWVFPGKERVVFGYLESDKDVDQYQGAAFPFIGFDELTQFSLKQYLYLFSRCRSAHGIPCRIRSTTNPGGDGHEWVFKRFGAWLDPKSKLHAAPGQALYFVKRDGEEVAVPKGTLDNDGTPAIGRVFVPAKLSDNPYLAADGQYARSLRELDPVTQKQLLEGDWLVKPAAGLYFKRTQVTYVDDVPRCPQWVRAWDLAATPETEDNDPAWTAGVKMGLLDGVPVIADVARCREDPAGVDALMAATAELDGPSVSILFPQDPGQAGVSQVQKFSRLLKRFTFKSVRPTGDKITRFGPFSSQAKSRGVILVRAPWNEAYIQELEGFPAAKIKDQVDATSDAYNELASLDVEFPDEQYDAWLPRTTR